MTRLIFVFSALLAAVAAFASDLTDFRERIDGADTKRQFERALSTAPESVRQDESYSYYFSLDLDEIIAQTSYDYGEPISWMDIRLWLGEELDARIEWERLGDQGQVSDATKEASEILSNPVYVDRGDREGRAWLDESTDRIGERLVEMLNSLAGQSPSSVPNVEPPPMFLLQAVVWALIILVLAIVLYFVVRNFGALKRRKRVGGLLEDDEPDRTADQWLLQAERLEREGRLRNAVRCLYLACLVRFDDGNIARFRRHETNWEHLYRIEASTDLPQDLQFRATTEDFDRIWYGNGIRGAEDVSHFKEVYRQICKSLQIKPAA